jgi:hypothetical protein
LNTNDEDGGLKPKFMATMTLLLAVAFVTASSSQRSPDGGQEYSHSLVVAPFAKSPNYLRYLDGRQRVIYTVESQYPAEDVLSFIKVELKKQGWKPLPQDFFNPDIPSSLDRGWDFFEDDTQKPATGVYTWNADWENEHHDITVYVLRYESPNNSTRDLRNLHVTALYTPSGIAAKMKRGGDKAKHDLEFKK